ncbi:hypothetical protein GOB57_25080 [Sinorhizobium meliloti]|nr:hypothetical protein [Sinorhizobium meliloti]
MGVVVDLESFRQKRRPARIFQSVACPLCDTQVNGMERGGEVVYACYGDATGHDRLEWSHAAEHVAVI